MYNFGEVEKVVKKFDRIVGYRGGDVIVSLSGFWEVGRMNIIKLY